MRQHHSPARSFVPSIAPFDFGTSASVCHKWDDRHETGGYEAYSLRIREGMFSETGVPVKVFWEVCRQSSAHSCSVCLHFLLQPRTKGAQRVDEWHDFFLAAAGAAAVLAGLVFVGVSINLEMIMSDPSYGLAGRALEALVLLVAVLIVTLLLLVPSQGMVLAGVEVLAVGVVVWAAVVIIQL